MAKIAVTEINNLAEQHRVEQTYINLQYFSADLELEGLVDEARLVKIAIKLQEWGLIDSE